MRAMVIHIVDELRIRYSRLNVTVFVDDFALAAAGNIRFVKQHLGVALEVTTRRLPEM